MTVAKSLLKDNTFEVIPDTLPSGREPVAMRYTVEVFKRGKVNCPEFGYVTTHLDIEEWCEMHGYGLMRYHAHCTRRPLPNEKPIDLF